MDILLCGWDTKPEHHQGDVPFSTTQGVTSAYGMALGLAAVSGQLIGGLDQRADVAGLGWRTVFLINIPLGLAGLALAPLLVPESRAMDASRLDLVGATLVTVGLVAIVLPLIESRTHGWPLWTFLSLAAAPLPLLPSPTIDAG
jgi:hypothetical protein